MTKGRSGRNAGTNKIGESPTTNAESPNMPAAQRAFPYIYIWTTWLTKLLTGESSREFAAWFRAHHQGWERPPNDFNIAQWQLDHTALLNDTRRKFEDSGYDVRVEAQNAFRLQGRTTTLAGQPGANGRGLQPRRRDHRRLLTSSRVVALKETSWDNSRRFCAGHVFVR